MVTQGKADDISAKNLAANRELFRRAKPVVLNTLKHNVSSLWKLSTPRYDSKYECSVTRLNEGPPQTLIAGLYLPETNQAIAYLSEITNDFEISFCQSSIPKTYNVNLLDLRSGWGSVDRLEN